MTLLSDALKEAIKNLHGCDSAWVEAVPVRETFEGEAVWEGTVQVFDLKGSPNRQTLLCLVCMPLTIRRSAGSVAVLRQGPVDSPQTAVRAAIVRRARQQGR